MQKSLEWTWVILQQYELRINQFMKATQLAGNWAVTVTLLNHWTCSIVTVTLLYFFQATTDVL